MADMKRVAVLGSTGSVGRSTLEVVAGHPDRLQLAGVAARSRIDLLAGQVAQAQPPLVAVWDEPRAREFAELTGRRDVLAGPDGLLALATHPDVDLVVVATSGCDALLPLVRAIQAGKQIALASKELLVMAGSLIMRLVEEHGTTLVPVDSEHAAIFQCLRGVSREAVERLIITGSGGPLWGMPAAARQAVTREQVLAHPRWRMGPKITVDSATLMNKGLEVIEAQWLFGLPLERVRVLIHPEAVVHAVVELIDGTSLAQLAPCDMRLPIQYALSFPERWGSAWPRLALTQAGPLQFFEPDTAKFPCLQLALDAAAAGGTACAALNGANDVAVQAYLDGHLAFTEIPRVIAEVLDQHVPLAHPTLDEILAVDAWSRKAAHDRIPQWSPR
ncbi:MAG: 1-deoxy-D-xylulose-5-phosphate reductoisomerase [Candidatus Omnitrophica bacterium]|nr:1-deoxy-D-xylulose-5-phosphate reductoisomerase [Candidatus Omnitrophota bacterium]